jgi:1,4-dihydroxy-2-naphthoyl-CoA hydrolase
MIWKNKYSIDQLNEISLNSMVSHLGITVTKIGDNFITATMPVDHRTVQPMGILHGGASVALAETMGSIASIMITDHRENDIVGVEINANHLRSVSKGVVTGKVQPVKVGRRLHVWQIDITDEQGKAVCSSRITVMVIPKESRK